MAQLQCTLSGCKDADNKDIDGTVVTFTDQLILSVKDQSISIYSNQVSVDFCSKSMVHLQIPHAYVQGTGGLGQPPQQEVLYGWKLPDGWVAQDGSLPYNTDEKAYYTAVNAIDIVPSGCSLSGGNMLVWGSIKNQCVQAGYTQSASITLSGTNPSVSILAPAGYTGSTACNVT